MENETPKISVSQRTILDYVRQSDSYEDFIAGLRRVINEKKDWEKLSSEWEILWAKYEDKIPASTKSEFEDIFSEEAPIDWEIYEIRINDSTNMVFLLGAGASAPSGIPTVMNLLPELLNRAKKLGREDLDKLAKWCEVQGISNIEDLMTTAYLADFAAKKQDRTSLLDYFLFGELQRQTKAVDISAISFLQETLQTLFALLTDTMISASPNDAHDAIIKFLKAHTETTIITTNYDGCIDEALLLERLEIKKTLGPEFKDDSEGIDLIKMHGSINWMYCDSCQDAREFPLLELKKDYEEDSRPFPIQGLCKCGGIRRQLLIPPLSFKFLMFPNLISVWNSAQERIANADYLVVIGYSFAEADTYITKIIKRSMTLKEDQKMVIITTNSNLVPMLRNQFSAQIEGFDPKRILKANSRCEEVLPRILDSFLGKTGLVPPLPLDP